MNDNWEGGYYSVGLLHYQMTESAVAWNNVTAINGPNGEPDGSGTSGNWVYENMNYVANYWSWQYGNVFSIDLFDNVGCCAGLGANLTYVHSMWTY